MGRVHTGYLHERAQPGVLRATQRLDARRDKCPVLAAERHDVRDGREGGKRVQFRKRRSLRISDQSHRGQKRASQLVRQSGLRRALGKGYSQSGSQGLMMARAAGSCRWGLVVVRDNHVHTPLCSQCHRRDGAYTAVYGDEERNTLSNKGFYRLIRKSVTVRNTVRQPHDYLRAELFQRLAHNDGGSDAIRVVVTEYCQYAHACAPRQECGQRLHSIPFRRKGIVLLARPRLGGIPGYFQAVV